MNRAPDYSAAYVILETDHPRGLSGHGLTFTIGRGTELCVEAIELLSGHVIGRTVEDIAADMAGFWRSLVADSQLRWLGPEKGVVHLATAALVNAVWDLYAKVEKKPLWKLLADMSPEQLVACIDFRYIDDVLSPDEATAMLRRLFYSRPGREAGRRGDRRARPQPRHVQAAAAGGGDRLLPGGQLPARRSQRSFGGTAARRQVRCPGLPARRRCRPVRIRPAPGDLRLHRRQRVARGPHLRVRRPPARALRAPGPARPRALPATDRARLQRRDQARFA